MKPKIAILLSNLVPFFIKEEACENMLIVTPKNTEREPWAQEKFRKEKVILFQFPDSGHFNPGNSREVIKHSDLGEILQKNKVEYFFLPHKNSPEIQDWYTKNNLKILGFPLEIQEKMENKRFFDTLMRKHKIPAPPNYNSFAEVKDKNTKLVFQEINSYGFFGTKFFNSTQEIKDFLGKESFDTQEYILRKHIPSTPYGVTIFIDGKGNFFFSAIRQQCYLSHKGIPYYFLGIQWIPTDHLTKKAKTNIEALLQKTVQMLKAEKLIGAFNFDFLLEKENAYLLECNPRFSSATHDIFSIPNITNCLDPWEFFCNIYTSKINPKISRETLPQSLYQGCLLDIDVQRKTQLKKIPRIGTYRVLENKIEFISESAQDIKNQPNCIFLYHDWDSPGTVVSKCVLCTLISNFPLYTKNGTLNKSGKNVYQFFKQSFL